MAPPQPVKKDTEPLKTINIYGLIPTLEYQRVKCCAEDLFKNKPETFAQPVINGMLEFKWAHWLEEKRKELRSEVWSFNDYVMIFVDTNLIGDAKTFLEWAKENHNYEDFRNDMLYETLKNQEYASYLESTKNDYVFLEIAIDNQVIGRLVIELFKQLVPKTCENFRLLCTGEKGRSSSGYTLHYKNHLFHRVVPNGWVQGGDIWLDKGNGGESVFGGLLEDESYAVPHLERGIVGMANNGRHTNGSQFYITLQPAAYLDKKYVAFGQVVEGSSVLKQIEKLETLNQRPKRSCKINDCGVFEFLF